MPMFSFRAYKVAEPSRFLARHARVQSGAALLLAAALTGCVSYEPLSTEPLEILRELDSVGWDLPGEPLAEGSTPEDSTAPSGGLTPGQLAAFAVSRNLGLKAVRAQVGVSQALLVEAGLLPDPEIGWNAMDILSSEIVDGTSSSIDYVSGISIQFPLLRPGERDALKGAARWRMEEALRQVISAEWQLARAVHLAYEDVRAAENLLGQNEQLTKVVEDTDDYFRRALEATVATAIESSLAHGDVLSIRAQTLRLRSRLREARQGLNALLGLPPGVSLDLSPPKNAGALPDLPDSADALTELAVQRRPDLNRLLAAYQAAEDDVRLEVARQFPAMSIGTGLLLVPGFFSRFNRPAIETAIARREGLRREIEAAVHEVRRDVHDLWAELEEIREEVGFLESELLPNAEDSLRLAGEAFEAGEATLVQILNVQRALVDARTRHGEAQAELARRTWQLRAAGGLILHEEGGPNSQTPEQDESTR
jgi:outer membrane protein, heavy metal efflux system